MPVRRSDVYVEWEEQLARGWIKFMNATNVAVYEASDGRIAGTIPSGTPLLLLTTTRANGRPHTVTVVYLDGDAVGRPGRWFVVGSNGGLSRDPAWVGHLTRRPSVIVQVGADRYDGRATLVPPGDLTTRVLDMLSNGYRPFGDYQQRALGAPTAREIKVVEIEQLRRH